MNFNPEFTNTAKAAYRIDPDYPFADRPPMVRPQPKHATLKIAMLIGLPAIVFIGVMFAGKANSTNPPLKITAQAEAKVGVKAQSLLNCESDFKTLPKAHLTVIFKQRPECSQFRLDKMQMLPHE